MERNHLQVECFLFCVRLIMLIRLCGRGTNGTNPCRPACRSVAHRVGRHRRDARLHAAHAQGEAALSFFLQEFYCRESQTYCSESICARSAVRSCVLLRGYIYMTICLERSFSCFHPSLGRQPVTANLQSSVSTHAYGVHWHTNILQNKEHMHKCPKCVEKICVECLLVSVPD